MSKSKRKSNIRDRFGRMLFGADGTVHRFRLSGGLGVAWSEDGGIGRLTLSRRSPVWPGDSEISVVRRDFRAACGDVNRPLHDIVECERVAGNGHNAIRFTVRFARQGVLL